MRPQPFLIITGATAWPHRNTPLRFTDTTASNCASSIRPTSSPSLIFTRRPSRRIPALLTRMSIPPSFATVAATAAWTAPASVTSTRWSAPSLTSHVTTVAPASRNTRAVSAPMPRAPPVITATRPSILVNSSCLPVILLGTPPAARVPHGDRPPPRQLRSCRVPSFGCDHATGGPARGAVRHARHARRSPHASAADPASGRSRDRAGFRSDDLRVLGDRPRRRSSVPHPGRGPLLTLHPHRARGAPRYDARSHRRRLRATRALAVPRPPRRRGAHRRGRAADRLRE